MSSYTENEQAHERRFEAEKPDHDSYAVLYGGHGCEIGREEFSSDEELKKILLNWAENLEPGDRIEIEGPA